MITPKLYIGIGKVLFIGPIDTVPAHRCMVPVFSAGLDRTVRVDVEGDDRITRSRYVGAGLLREVQAYGSRLAVMLIDPELAVASPWDEDAAIANLQTLAEEFNVVAWRGLNHALGLPESRTQVPENVARRSVNRKQQRRKLECAIPGRAARFVRITS
jgi:hypothetical protein